LSYPDCGHLVCKKCWDTKLASKPDSKNCYLCHTTNSTAPILLQGFSGMFRTLTELRSKLQRLEVHVDRKNPLVLPAQPLLNPQESLEDIIQQMPVPGWNKHELALNRETYRRLVANYVTQEAVAAIQRADPTQSAPIRLYWDFGSVNHQHIVPLIEVNLRQAGVTRVHYVGTQVAKPRKKIVAVQAHLSIEVAPEARLKIRQFRPEWRTNSASRIIQREKLFRAKRQQQQQPPGTEQKASASSPSPSLSPSAQESSPRPMDIVGEGKDASSSSLSNRNSMSCKSACLLFGGMISL
jgi:hypothetical protein